MTLTTPRGYCAPPQARAPTGWSCATPTPTSTSTDTPTETATITPTVTPTTPALLVGHVTWQGRPAQPNALQQLPITLTLKSGGTKVNYPSQNTDASGYFTVSVEGLASGTYDWRVKGPKYLANSGSLVLTGLHPGRSEAYNLPTFQPSNVQTLEAGSMKAGDCNNDNVVGSVDVEMSREVEGDPALSLWLGNRDGKADIVISVGHVGNVRRHLLARLARRPD